MKAFLQRVLFLFGVVLAIAAFLAAGAELAATAMDPALGLLPSADAVWRTLSPASHEAARGFAWVALALDTLAVPGWLILGAPGLALIIVCHERDETISAEHEQSLFLFDELAKHAREEGFHESGSEIEAHNHPDFTPADPHYARDDVVDDLIGEHDFLIDPHAPKDKPPTPDA